MRFQCVRCPPVLPFISIFPASPTVNHSILAILADNCSRGAEEQEEKLRPPPLRLLNIAIFFPVPCSNVGNYEKFTLTSYRMCVGVRLPGFCIISCVFMPQYCLHILMKQPHDGCREHCWPGHTATTATTSQILEKMPLAAVTDRPPGAFTHLTHLVHPLKQP